MMMAPVPANTRAKAPNSSAANFRIALAPPRRTPGTSTLFLVQHDSGANVFPRPPGAQGHPGPARRCGEAVRGLRKEEERVRGGQGDQELAAEQVGASLRTDAAGHAQPGGLLIS